MKRIFFLLNLLLPLALLAAPAEAEPLSYVGEQTLLQDTVWQGEILVDGILTVPPGVTLEIRPGTIVRFTSADTNGDGIGEHEIFFQGTLRALGTPEAPIIFTAAGPDPRPGSWGAINIMVSDEENILAHCRIEYAYRGFHAHFSRAGLRDSLFENNVRGMQFQESTVKIERCRIVGNLNGIQFRDSHVVIEETTIADNSWGVRAVYSEVEIRRCRIVGNTVNGANLRDSRGVVTGNLLAGNRKGLYLQNGQKTVVEMNSILDNSEHGIFLEKSISEIRRNRISGNGRAGIRWLDSDGELRDNDLSGNGEYALINDGAGAVDARRNWWGSRDPQTVARLIRDSADRGGVGAVDAAELLTQAPGLAEPGQSQYVPGAP